jgi:hypothetical protein
MLVGGIRRLAFDRTWPASEALGRIRDAFQDYDTPGVGFPGVPFVAFSGTDRLTGSRTK